MIVANPNLLCNLRGILLFGSILETLNCLCTFFTIPFVYSTHDRIFAFANHGFHISSQLLNTTAIGVTTLSIVVCWSFTTFHRTKPKLGYLLLYTMIPICSSLIYGCCSMKSMNLLELPEEKIIKNRELILRHYGILIDKVEILETSYRQKKCQCGYHIRNNNAHQLRDYRLLLNWNPHNVEIGTNHFINNTTIE
ncbi:hypothetical protein M3Y98_01208800 [Aphelenchoides besseyi]|nr:hypothetical protein M3Y98_01208800 [Aphelenchoides besseyi]